MGARLKMEIFWIPIVKKRLLDRLIDVTAVVNCSRTLERSFPQKHPEWESVDQV